MTPGNLFAIGWIGFAISWLLAALWRTPAVSTVSGPLVWLYRVLLVAGTLLLNPSTTTFMHPERLWPMTRALADALALLTLPGYAFAWWARLYLGPLWSSAVTRKQDHRIVDTGPYRLVRHPIYTGILWACLVTTIAVGTMVALLGFLAILAGFWIKARLEEGLLRQDLGVDRYAAYQRRVPMLVPFWPVRAGG